ncbi:MAG: Asp-tRNA(Asn)/Glu-tRNA(Gln) amidotransferase subunit GatB, partial [Candidatus Colwellbacteria bacterium]|nr:Asp-tRNA(Asn)/Glu-tRNA(Gln) amidotransferase subunit GatB [Candidatus Colwellbacteria bacterium]
MRAYAPTIGLEVHIELRTKRKMFCDCPNETGETRPNTNVCPVCLGHPGVLPTANKEAVIAVLKLALATGATPAAQAKFDRKSYFYPDLPKNYQISQYDEPLAQGGSLNGVRIRRIHLEEDTGRLLHGGAGSCIDFNRAGVPLMELVTEPDIRDAESAVSFAKELQRICRYLDIARGDLENGEMRIEANVSVSKTDALGTKVEVKNLNSFKAAGEAIAYEIARHEDLLEQGNSVIQETRGWDEKKRTTVSQRRKEEAHD